MDYVIPEKRKSNGVRSLDTVEKDSQDKLILPLHTFTVDRRKINLECGSLFLFICYYKSVIILKI